MRLSRLQVKLFMQADQSVFAIDTVALRRRARSGAQLQRCGSEAAGAPRGSLIKPDLESRASELMSLVTELI